MAYLIDSDVLIWHLRGHPLTVHLLQELTKTSSSREGWLLPLGCSVISVFEVLAGMRSDEKVVTEQLLATLERYPVDEAIAEKAAEYFRAFAKQGITLHIADLLIAATASLQRLTLATYNGSHFPMNDIRLHEPMPEF